MTKKKKRVNPFYILLVLAGIVFAVTACAYGVMAVKQMHATDIQFTRAAAEPQGHARDADFVQFMDDYGARLMLGELAVLAVTSAAAIGTDRFWVQEE